MSREHLWVMQSLPYRFKNKTPLLSSWVVYKIPCIMYTLYKIPYRRARAFGLAAAQPLHFRPSASREQRYLAYNLMGCTIAELETAHKTLVKRTVTIYIFKAFFTLVITIYIIIKLHFGSEHPFPIGII